MNAALDKRQTDAVENAEARCRDAERRVCDLEAALGCHTSDLGAVETEITSAAGRGAPAGELAKAVARRLSLEIEIRIENSALAKARELAKDEAEELRLARAADEKRALQTQIEAVYGDFDERFNSAAQTIVSVAASNARLVKNVELANRRRTFLRALPSPSALCSMQFLGRLMIPGF